jgi:hypothetical protein
MAGAGGASDGQMDRYQGPYPEESAEESESMKALSHASRAKVLMGTHEAHQHYLRLAAS